MSARVQRSVQLHSKYTLLTRGVSFQHLQRPPRETRPLTNATSAPSKYAGGVASCGGKSVSNHQLKLLVLGLRQVVEGEYRGTWRICSTDV